MLDMDNRGGASLEKGEPVSAIPFSAEQKKAVSADALPKRPSVYDSIPPERLNGIPCVGFHLKDGSIYEGDYPLMYGGNIDRDGINLVEHYKESPLVQKAISDLQAILDHRTAMQQRSAERDADPDEVCYKVSSMYLHIQEASDGCWDFTLYDNQLREIDGGQLGDPDTPLSEFRDDVKAASFFADICICFFSF